jgi:hypothetical protein
MEAGSAQPVVEAAKPPPVETAQRADDEPAKLPEPVKPPVVGHTPQPTGIVTANSKGSGPARRGPAPGTGSGSTNQEPDPAVQDQLAQAEQELATGNVDMAWRLANTIINTGHGAARAQAIGIHGVIECTRHNSAEGAGIDLRRLGGGGPARERILAACHARDMLVEEH